MKKESHKQLIIEQLKKTPVVQVACEKVGVGRSTYYRWRKEDGEFAKKADKAKKKGSQMINDMAESQLISAIRDRNMTAIIFWLKRRHPDFANKIKVSGEIKHSRGELSDEEKSLIKEAAKLALPEDSTNSQTDTKLNNKKQHD